MKRIVNGHFQDLNIYVQNIQKAAGATAAAVCIIHKDTVVNEWYAGTHDSSPESRKVDEATRFNVGSIRKTYLGLAVSLLIEQGRINSVDDEIAGYLNELEEAAKGVTLRQLLTHTHGLMEADGATVREFPTGESWAYRNTGITLLTRLVKHLSAQNVSEFVQSSILAPYHLNKTGWRTSYDEHLIYNYYKDKHTWVGPNDSDAGDQGNLFISADDMAAWGYIHLRKGCVNGKQVLPQTVFERVTELHTPSTVPEHLPRNGFVWWLQGSSPLNQIGEHVPNGAYQILGITGCVCLVIPHYDAVVVRMYNQLNNPVGFDYLSEIRMFGNIAAGLLDSYKAAQSS